MTRIFGKLFTNQTEGNGQVLVEKAVAKGVDTFGSGNHVRPSAWSSQTQVHMKLDLLSFESWKEKLKSELWRTIRESNRETTQSKKGPQRVMAKLKNISNFLIFGSNFLCFTILELDSFPRNLET